MYRGINRTSPWPTSSITSKLKHQFDSKSHLKLLPNIQHSLKHLIKLFYIIIDALDVPPTHRSPPNTTQIGAHRELLTPDLPISRAKDFITH